MIGGKSKNVKHRGHRGSERNVEMPFQVNIGEGARGPSTSQVLALRRANTCFAQDDRLEAV